MTMECECGTWEGVDTVGVDRVKSICVGECQGYTKANICGILLHKNRFLLYFAYGTQVPNSSDHNILHGSENAYS